MDLRERIAFFERRMNSALDGRRFEMARYILHQKWAAEAELDAIVDRPDLVGAER